VSYAATIQREEGKPPITLDEWTAVVRGNPALEGPEDGVVDSATWKDDDTCLFVFQSHGVVVIDHLTDGWEQIIGEVAAQLDAVAIGDDGERYLPDGTVVGEPPR